MRLKARAPSRIDFSGGWTDVDLTTHEIKGAVLNAAIRQYVEGESRPTSDTGGKNGYYRAEVYYLSEIPPGAGLGGSSAFRLVQLALMGEEAINSEEKRAALADEVYHFERRRMLCGKQDQYAAALGGINYMEFDGDKVEFKRLDLPSAILKSLEEGLVLCYTGKARLSDNVHQQVWGRFGEEKQKPYESRTVTRALRRLSEIPDEQRTALQMGELPYFASLMSENWRNQKMLADCITNSDIELLYQAAMKHGDALGGKACGAGGGGCFVFYTDDREKLESALGAVISELPGAKILPVKFDYDGLVCEQVS